MGDRDLYAGPIRLHVLHHAAESPGWGAWIIEELRRHGYVLSPGTLYPMLHGLERKDGEGKRAPRRCYVIRPRSPAHELDSSPCADPIFYCVPRSAEMCGPEFNPDGRTLFVAVPFLDGYASTPRGIRSSVQAREWSGRLNGW